MEADRDVYVQVLTNLIKDLDDRGNGRGEQKREQESQYKLHGDSESVYTCSDTGKGEGNDGVISNGEGGMYRYARRRQCCKHEFKKQ